MTKEEKKYTKKILRQWGNDKEIIQLEYDEIKRIKDIIKGMEDINTLLPLSRSAEDNYIKAVELCENRINDISKKIGDLIEFKNKLDEIIEGLDFEMKYIIKCKYLENMDWETLSAKYPIPMSLRNFYRLYNESLEIIYNKINENEVLPLG